MQNPFLRFNEAAGRCVKLVSYKTSLLEHLLLRVLNLFSHAQISGFS